jgi:hypothetical protein
LFLTLEGTTKPMCPVCWATLLAWYAGFVSLGAATVMRKDGWMLGLAAAAGGLAVGHSSGLVVVPWWLLAAALVVLSIRWGWLLARRWPSLFVRSWHHAAEVAAARCPRKTCQ